MGKAISPPVKTAITGEGTVVWHDETRHGLRRMCVMSRQKYPDIEMWVGMLPGGADVKATRYTQREASGVWQYFLWIYWKESP